MWRLLIFLLWATHDSCGLKNTAEIEKQKAFENCMLGKDISLSEDEKKKICDCWAQKIGELKMNKRTSEAGINTIAYDNYLQDCKTELVKK